MTIHSISDMTSIIRDKLENTIPPSYIQGEISECKYHGSGHVYLTLKDDRATMPAVIWKSTVPRLKAMPRVGMSVVVYGKLSVYPPHGKYQLVISGLQESGVGVLYARFEALKSQLQDEGIFDPDTKKEIPEFPQSVGLVTSETGAALQDMLRTFSQSAPHIKLTLAPARVQGKGAENTVISALESLKALKPSMVIVARGGGSIEDLWPFNEEVLARYAADYPIPLISGVGHETDTSILDFAADYRCSTPTNAAEYACRAWRDVEINLNHIERRLYDDVSRRMDLYRTSCEHFAAVTGFSSFYGLWEKWHERIDKLYLRMSSSGHALQRKAQDIDHFQHQLEYACKNAITGKQIAYNGLDRELQAYNPEHIMKKGYSIIRRGKSVITSAEMLSPGDVLELELSDARLISSVDEIRKKD